MHAKYSLYQIQCLKIPSLIKMTFSERISKVGWKHIVFSLCDLVPADLAQLQKSGTLSEAFSHDAKASLLAAALRQQHQQMTSAATTTTNNCQHHHHHHLLNSQQHQHHQIIHHSPAAAAAALAHHQHQQQQQLSLHQHFHQHQHGQHPLEVLGLSKTASLTQLSSMAHCPPSPTPIFNGMAHPHGRIL